MARPVLASSAAAEGIDARNGEHFCVSTSLIDEAEQAIALLSDPDRCAQIGAAARAHVLAHYGWQAALDPLEAALTGHTPLRAMEQAA